MTIEINKGSYGFGHTWTLNVYGKRFWLGQDNKFCERVLGMSPLYVASQIGSKDLRKESTKTELARFICRELGITRKSVVGMAAWDICAE